ncbi:MAG: adenylyl cyclase, partial [Xanthomonadales bacterium]|nr:adenylyl cyclase [Xanthomonadales bacterium]NIX13847.1 adenylyl cyclase [Xanthomonadales bacterium]
MSIFNELKRRNVFRVAIAYVVASWVLLQVADLFMGYVDAPDWVMHVLMFFIGLGFVVALIFSWLYELTPEGIKRERDARRGESITVQTGRKLDRIIIAFLAIAVVVLLYRQSMLNPGDEPGL